MKFIETELRGAFIIEPERIEDERGFFARVWCQKELKAAGLDTRQAQCNMSFNKYKNTIRGMHYQKSPHEEIKIVRCINGAIYDIIIDLRPNSPTYMKWRGFDLTQENRRMLYIPKGFAHGYQTLDNETEIFYQVSEFYSPKAEHGIRWDDAAFSIKWRPYEKLIISEKDKHWDNYLPLKK